MACQALIHLVPSAQRPAALRDELIGIKEQTLPKIHVGDSLAAAALSPCLTPALQGQSAFSLCQGLAWLGVGMKGEEEEEEEAGSVL